MFSFIKKLLTKIGIVTKEEVIEPALKEIVGEVVAHKVGNLNVLMRGEKFIDVVDAGEYVEGGKFKKRMLVEDVRVDSLLEIVKSVDKSVNLRYKKAKDIVEAVKEVETLVKEINNDS